jgi:hypothetical protein
LSRALRETFRDYAAPGSLATCGTSTLLEEKNDQQDDENQQKDSTTDVHAASFRCELSGVVTRSAAQFNMADR